MILSRKALAIEPSVTLEISAKAKALKDSGIDVISFSIGEPDFNTPENIRQEAIRAIEEGHTKYTPVSGIPQLRKAVCQRLKIDNNLDYSPENILVSSGGKHSIYNAIMAILNPGDEVIIGVPYWVSYPEIVRLADGVPVFIETKEENDFKFGVNDLERVKTARTKALIINTPSNPNGSIYTENELREIAEWAVKNNIFVISDELYEKLIYDNYKHVSIASFNDQIKDLTILINGMSKAYAMTGWRIGFTAAHKDIIKLMNNIQGQTTSNPSSIAQFASVVGLNDDQSSLDEMKKEFDKRRIYMYETINTIKGLSCRRPKGAFYIMVNISKLKGRTIKGMNLDSSLDIANLLLEKANVAVVPGIGFGDDNYIRLSYATSMDNIEEGLKRIRQVIEE